MGSLHQAARPDDAVDQLLLAGWSPAHMVRFRRVAGDRLAAREAAVVKLRDCSAGDSERQDAALPCAGVAGGGFYAGIARTGFHFSFLRFMILFLNMQSGARIVPL